MAKVDELMARMMARERRTDELCAALMDGMAREKSGEDEVDEHEEIVKAAYAKMEMKMKAMCAVAAGMEEVAAAERRQQSAIDVCVIVQMIERVPLIAIDVALTAAAAAVMFARAVTAELSAVAVVWWGGCDERVVMGEEVVRFTDWMREWEAMVRWCGGGRWSRPLLIE